jgi:hypothetical protein
MTETIETTTAIVACAEAARPLLRVKYSLRAGRAVKYSLSLKTDLKFRSVFSMLTPVPSGD